MTTGKESTPRLTVRPLIVFIVTLSLLVVPVTPAAHETTVSKPRAYPGTIISTPGTNPTTLWAGSGPAADTLRLQYYSGLTGDTNEYNALCFALPTTCTPAIDLTDVQIPTSEVSPTNINDPRFYVTPESPAFDFEHVDFNLANSFFGVEFCNGADGITAASTCPDGPGATAIPATCPNMPAPHASDCTFAGISIRQGIAHLIDKAAYVSNDLLNRGVAIDNVLASAQNTLHSGQDFGIYNPTSTTPASIGPYAVDPTKPIGSQQVTIGSEAQCVTVAQITGNGGACELDVGGTCSWDVLVTCSGTFQGQSQMSAFHLTGDAAADSNGMVPTGSPDFCATAQDFVNAGLGFSVSTPATGCQVLGFTGFNTGIAGTPGGPLLLYRRTSLDRGPLFNGLGVSICELIHGPGVTSCAEVSVQTISAAQAHFLVFAQGCKSSLEPGTTCASQGPKRTWSIYDGGNSLAVTVNNLYALYSSQFASDLCGGAGGDQPLNYVLACNTKADTWSNYGQFTTTPDIAVADTQVANDIFGNHTFAIPMFAHFSQDAWLSGWQGVSNAAGFGITHRDFYSLLNAWSPNPAVPGPTIRWGQRDSPSSLNPFSFDSEIGANVIQSVYDSLLVPNPYQPAMLYGWMVNSYQIVLNSQDLNCPTNVRTASGSWAVAGCVRISLRGDISWHDVYNCAPSDAACLQSHIVTAQDVKFSFANYNATDGLITPFTQNTVDVVYNPSVLPSAAFGAYGGTSAAGQPETIYIALKSLSAWALFDIANIPIIPQHVWANATSTGPCLSPRLGGAIVNDTYARHGACNTEAARLSGPGSDPVANNFLIGSGPWVCASGTLGASGTIYGGGCSTSGNQTPAPGDAITLHRFQYQGSIVAQQGGLNSNYAYFRTNAKYLQFLWAAYPGVDSVSSSAISSATNSCKSNATAIGGVNDYAACQHWNTLSAGLACTSSAGPCIGTAGGGRGTLPGGPAPVLVQISRWASTRWTFGVPSYSSLVGAQAIPQTLYEDGSSEGSFTIATSSTSVTTFEGTPASVAIPLALSGGPGNNFTSPVTVSLATVQTLGLTAILGSSTVNLSPGAPSASTTLQMSSMSSGSDIVIVRASAPNFPAVTVTITSIVTPAFGIASSGDVGVSSRGVAYNNITVTSLGGLAQSVSLSCGGLSPGIECLSFYPSSGVPTPTFRSRLTIVFTNSTPPSTSTSFLINVTGNMNGIIHSTQFNLSIASGTIGGERIPLDRLSLVAPYVPLFLGITVISLTLVIFLRHDKRMKREATITISKR